MTAPLLDEQVAVVAGARQGGRVVLPSDLSSYITGTVIEVGGG